MVEKWQELNEERDREWHAANVPSQTQTRDITVHGLCLNTDATIDIQWKYISRCPVKTNSDSLLTFRNVKEIFDYFGCFLIISRLSEWDQNSDIFQDQYWMSMGVYYMLSMFKPTSALHDKTQPPLSFEWDHCGEAARVPTQKAPAQKYRVIHQKILTCNTMWHHPAGIVFFKTIIDNLWGSWGSSGSQIL